MLSTEKCFDILPYVADIFDKLELFKYIKENQIKNNVEDEKVIEALSTEAGSKLMVFIFRNISKIKEEVFNIVAVLQDKNIEDVKRQPIGDTINAFMVLIDNKEAMDFFKSAMR